MATELLDAKIFAKAMDRGGAVYNVLAYDSVQEALDEAPDGSTVLFPPGDYTGTGLTVAGKSLRLVGPGARLIQDTDAAILTLDGGWGTIYAITGIVASSYDFSAGAGVSTDVTRLDFASPPELVAGDVVKIVSDDQLAGASSATRRRGEFAVVGAVSGSSVYLTGRIKDTYTTVPRVAKLAGYSFAIEGITFDSTNPGAWTNGLVLISAAKDISIRGVRVQNGGGLGIKLIGCYGFSVLDYRASNLKNSPSASQFGYGILLSACEHGSISHSTFYQCRHGISTDASTSDAGSADIERFGRVRHVTVSHSHGQGCSNSAFDCHNDAYDVTFDHCTGDAEYRGEDSTGAPFQIRGKRIRLHHCRGRGRYGVAIYDDGGGATDEITLHDCDVEGQVGAIFASKILLGTIVTNVTIDGGVYRSSGFYGMQLQDTGITLLNSPRIVLTGTSANTRGLDLTASTLQIGEAKLDITGSTAADIYAIVFRDAVSAVTGPTKTSLGAVARSGRLRIDVGAASFHSFARGTSAGFGTVDNVEVSYDVAPGTFTANLLSLVAFRSKVDGNQGASSAFRAQDLNADDAELDIAGVADPIIYIRVRALGANKNLGALPNGAFPGQVLLIRSHSPDAYTVTVRTGTTYNTDMNANKVLANGDVLYLVYAVAANSRWVLLNHYDRP